MLIGGNQPLVTGTAPNFDSSDAGKAASAVYADTVAAVAREFGWDFARNTVALTTTGNTAPFPWSVEYNYPNGVQVWQLAPASLTDANNPLPVNWAVGNAQVSGAQKKVIWSNLSGALATYNNNPAESLWDGDFVEAVVRLLASKLAMAIAGKPDTAQGLLQSGAAFETIAEGRNS